MSFVSTFLRRFTRQYSQKQVFRFNLISEDLELAKKQRREKFNEYEFMEYINSMKNISEQRERDRIIQEIIIFRS